MRKQNLLFIPFVLGIGIWFNSCMGNGHNVTTYPPTPAVVVDVRMDEGGTIIGTPFGYIAAPGLTNNFLGDCLYINTFTIDYDNQPSNQYYTATQIDKQDVGQHNLEQSLSVELGEDTLMLSTLNGLSDPHFNGKFFIVATSKDNIADFRLVYNRGEEEVNGVKNLYLLAKPSSSISNATTVSSIYAFDVNSLIYAQQNNDTIISTVNYKYIKANLKYFSGITDGEPVYKTVNDLNSPFEIYIYQ